jgi:CHAD domain-containing protein
LKVVEEHHEERQPEGHQAYRFEAGEPLYDGVGRIARGQLDLTIGRLETAPAEDDGGEAVHEARKALKRLRALLRLSRGAIDRHRYRHENGIFRDVGRALSGMRDAQVLLDTVDALTARYSPGLRESVWTGLRQSLVAEAERSSTLEPDHVRNLVGMLSEARTRVGTWLLPPDGGPAAFAGGFAWVYRRGRRAYGSASSDQSVEALHELRKRAKDLWHAAQLLEPVCAEQMKALKRSAHHLSDLLGEDHDLTILREHAEQRSELLTAVELELLIALIDHRQAALRREALTCAADLYRQKPKRILHELALC